jgi:hypothetical protein
MITILIPEINLPNLYRITPLEKKSIKQIFDLYQRDADGNIRGFEIFDHYRWGAGFLELEDLPLRGVIDVYCDPEISLGCELDDQVALFFEFDNSFSEKEQREIRKAYQWGGTSWMLNGDHSWEIESHQIEIIGPYQIDLVDEYGKILEENVEPQEPTDA